MNVVYTFESLHAADPDAVETEINVANAKLARSFPGCSAETIDKGKATMGAAWVSVAFAVSRSASPKCIEWYSALLNRHGIALVHPPGSSRRMRLSA